MIMTTFPVRTIITMKLTLMTIKTILVIFWLCLPSQRASEPPLRVERELVAYNKIDEGSLPSRPADYFLVIHEQYYDRESDQSQGQDYRWIELKGILTLLADSLTPPCWTTRTRSSLVQGSCCTWEEKKMMVIGLLTTFLSATQT